MGVVRPGVHLELAVDPTPERPAGQHALDGLRDDLKLMREKLEKKVKPSGKNDEQESEVGTILSPGENDSIKKSDNSGVKSKLEVLRELKALLDEKIIDDKEFKKMKHT